MILEKGYTQIYTGNGKGKTTAALGQAFRASGSGYKSFIIQFMKGQHSGELNAVKDLGKKIVIERYGSKKFCRPADDETFKEHKEFTLQGLERAKEILSSNKYSLVILDEIITTTLFDLITDDEIIDIISQKPEHVELILTGRGASENLIAHADLVTEMKEIKHYYNNGVAARNGIED